MTEEEFMELMRTTIAHKCFAGATSAVVILFKEEGDTVGTYCRGFFDMENVEALIKNGQYALEGMRDMDAAEDVRKLQ